MKANIDRQVIYIVRHAAKYSPYYQKLYTRHGVDPLAIQNKEDLSKLPLVTPDDLMANWSDMRSKDVTPYRVTSSSGTLGNPKTLFRTVKDTNTSVNGFVRLLEMAGLEKGDSMLVGQPFDLAHLGYLAVEACASLGIMAIPCGISITNEQMITLIHRFRPNVLFTSISRLKDITHMMLEEDSKVPKIKRVLLAGEPIFPAHRSFVKDQWGSLPIDLYGSEETDGLGGSCTHNHLIHFFDDLFHLELLEHPQAKGRDNMGEAVVTSLYSQGTPLIRYRLGDLLSIEKWGCHCGHDGPMVKVYGRLNDVLYLYDGIKLFGFQIESLLTTYVQGLERFQIQCRSIVPGINEVAVLVVGAMTVDVETIEQNLANEVWNCSQDLGAARDMGSIYFKFIINRTKLVQTKRGKTPRIIDLRIDQAGA